MDAVSFQVLFNIAIALIGVLGGLIIKIIFDRLKRIEDMQENLAQKLPETYASKSDIYRMFDSLIAQMHRIEDKLDRKQDKE